MTNIFPCVLRCSVLIALVERYVRAFRTNVLCMSIARAFSNPGSKSVVQVEFLPPLTCLPSPLYPLCCACSYCGCIAFALDKGKAEIITM